MNLLSHRNLIRRVDPWMPIKLRSVMTGPEIGVYVSMSLYLQAADVHRTLGNGGSDISGANPCQEPKILLSYWATHLPSQRTIGFYPCSQAAKLLQPYQRHFFPLISDLKASPSDAHSRGRPHFALSSAMEALSTSENGAPAEGVQSQQPTKSSKQRFKPQLSCTFCRNRK
jgi:hypothetical protein